MIRINENYTKLKASYLFADIARRVGAYAAAHPDKPVIRLGIGDVTEPLPPACVEALHAATDEMSRRATFRGYGPEQGYAFLGRLVASTTTPRAAAGSSPTRSSSPTARSATAATSRRSSPRHPPGDPDPVYPVYVDTNVMAGARAPMSDGRYEGILYLESTPANGYVPAVPAAGRPRLPLLPEQPDRRRRHPRSSPPGWTTRGATRRSSSSTRPTRPTSATRRSRTRSTRSRAPARSRSSSGASPRRPGSRGLRCAYTVVPKTLMAWDRAGRRTAPRPLEPPAHDEVQRRLLPRPEGRRGRLHRGRAAARRAA
jgi:LL-diaminopimelate aminotransferase